MLKIVSYKYPSNEEIKTFTATIKKRLELFNSAELLDASCGQDNFDTKEFDENNVDEKWFGTLRIYQKLCLKSLELHKFV